MPPYGPLNSSHVVWSEEVSEIHSSTAVSRPESVTCDIRKCERKWERDGNGDRPRGVRLMARMLKGTAQAYNWIMRSLLCSSAGLAKQRAAQPLWLD